jgi:hypothetical protein
MIIVKIKMISSWEDLQFKMGSEIWQRPGMYWHQRRRTGRYTPDQADQNPVTPTQKPSILLLDHQVHSTVRVIKSGRLLFSSKWDEINLK